MRGVSLFAAFGYLGMRFLLPLTILEINPPEVIFLTIAKRFGCSQVYGLPFHRLSALWGLS